MLGIGYCAERITSPAVIRQARRISTTLYVISTTAARIERRITIKNFDNDLGAAD
jgi:hypothetical protein